MRRYILGMRAAPVNPPSILGYKETVDARLTKDRVLYDDLTLLRSCDDLVVFSDVAACADSVGELAEGAIVELLYFLATHGPRTIRFVSPVELLRAVPQIRQCRLSSEAVEAALDADQRSAIRALLEPVLASRRAPPPVTFHISDPLDFKYAHWLRPQPYREGAVPLVPGLAVELLDAPPHGWGLGAVLASWFKLQEVSQCAVAIESMQPDFNPSLIATAMARRWRAIRAAAPVERLWEYYGVPKACLGEKWPVTDREIRQVRLRKHNV